MNLVSLEYLELVALLDPPSLAHWAHLVHLANLAQWDHQVRYRRPHYISLCVKETTTDFRVSVHLKVVLCTILHHMVSS